MYYILTVASCSKFVMNNSITLYPKLCSFGTYIPSQIFKNGDATFSRTQLLDFIGTFPKLIEFSHEQISDSENQFHLINLI